MAPGTTTIYPGIEAFVSVRRAKSGSKVKASIVERWNTRVVPRGLHQKGGDGAASYLESYGKGISVGKLVELAICAETHGAREMAVGFWEEAFCLETGAREKIALGETSSSDASQEIKSPLLEGIPAELQPGTIHTMQAVDGRCSRDSYAENADYYGQPKRDGHRNVFFATKDAVVHQSRSTSLMSRLDQCLEEAARRAARAIGPFVLDGERYYLSADGREHRTAAQAGQANIDLGCGSVEPVEVYGVFKALYAGGRDLRGLDEDQRIEAGVKIAALVGELNSGSNRIEALPTARTTKEKRQLIQKQMSEGREGEIWIRKHCSYSRGKQHKNDLIRTKYLSEDIFKVVSVELGGKSGVASIEVAREDGAVVGKVGTGFDKDMNIKLLESRKRLAGQVKVLVRYQGMTAGGKLWHARLIDVV